MIGATNGVASLNGSSLVIQNPANAVVSPAAGKIPLANGTAKIDNGWLNTGAGNGLDADTLDGQHGAYYLDRANHTGSQTANTISDFDAQVRTNRLDQMSAPTASVNFNSQKITNLATPVAGTDAANKDYVDSVSQGLDPKTSVKAATTGNVVLNGPLNVDGISLIAGDRVLVKNQTLPEENGVYVVQSGAWTRSTDTDTWDELTSAYVFVEEGTVNANSGWLCDVDAGGTLGTTAVSWAQFSQAGSVTGSNVGSGSVNVFKQKTGSALEFRTLDDTSSVSVTQTGDVITFDVLPSGVDINQLSGTPLTVAKGGTGSATAAGAKTNLGFTTKYSETFGDNSATTFVITHNLGTDDVIAQVRYATGIKAVVEPDIETTSINTITLRFNRAPALNEFRVTVIG